MRKRIPAAALLSVAAATGWLALDEAASRPEKAGAVTNAVCPVTYHAPAFRQFAARVWRLPRWERGKPRPATLQAMRQKRRCAAGPGHRIAMRRAWREAKRRYYEHRRAKQDEAHYLDAVTPPGMATLSAIAACESGGDPTAVSADGTYRGKYQFDYTTWASVGGSGDPAAAPEREQDERAAALYRIAGSSPWPVCG